MNLDSRFWPVFREKAELCAGGDTSLRADVAAELMASIEYVLSRFTGALAAGDPQDVFCAAENALRADVERTLEMFERMQETMVALHSRVYSSVPLTIAPFFRRYQYHLFAHQIPCTLDYQPAMPVGDRQGVDYIADYIARIILENALLGRFEPAAIERLLQQTLPDWRDSVENIYTPVLVNAAALLLTGREAQSLRISPGDCPAALEALRSMQPRFLACTRPDVPFVIW